MAGIVEFAYRYAAGDVAPRALPQDAAAALERLASGNRAFAALLREVAGGCGTHRHTIPVDARDLGIGATVEGAPPQNPFAAIVGCADARVPVELVFNEGPNDLFVVRVAGNGMSADVLGSLRYAIDHLAASLRTVLVLGHSGCGAISVAVDVYRTPGAYLQFVTKHGLRGLLDRIFVLVHAAELMLADVHGAGVADRPGYRSALIETTIAMNAAWGAFMLQQELLGLGRHAIAAAYGVYLLESREIWAPTLESGDWRRPVEAPADPAALRLLLAALVRSERIAALLDAS